MSPLAIFITLTAVCLLGTALAIINDIKEANKQ
jgi:hypothetical protein